MSFSYFDNDKQLQKIDVQVGAKWADYKTDNEKLNSIFNEVDDGDGIVQLTEKMMLDNLIKQADNQAETTANNNILEDEELAGFDITKALLQSEFDRNRFSLASIKSAYPEDNYTYTKNGEETIIIDKSTGKKVLYIKGIEDADWKFIEEYTGDDKLYTVKINKGDAEISLGTETNRNKDSHYKYRNSELTSFYGSGLKLGWKDSIQEELLFRNLQNPDWIKNDAINYLDNMSSKDLLKVLSGYNKRTEGEYLLDKIYFAKEIPEDTKLEFFKRTMQRLEAEAGYKQEMTNENSQVSTEFYKSKDSYTVHSSNGIITIKKNTPEGSSEDTQEYTLDLNRLVSRLPFDMRPKTKAVVQNLPGEVLADMAVECDRFNPPVDDAGFRGNTSALFDPIDDRISFGYTSFDNINPQTLVHELGHAIDYRQKQPNGENPSAWDEDYSILHNQKLKEEYYKAKYKYAGIYQYITENPETHERNWDENALLEKGFLRVDDNGRKVWSSKYNSMVDSAYMFSDITEGPSELYLFAMLGSSRNTPKDAVTPELMQAFLENLEYTRGLRAQDRHIKEK